MKKARFSDPEQSYVQNNPGQGFANFSGAASQGFGKCRLWPTTFLYAA